MGLVSRAQFEQRLVSHLNGIEPGFAYRAKRKVGYAWGAILDHMYRKHGDGVTFANLASLIAGCAQDIVRLTENLKDE